MYELGSASDWRPDSNRTLKPAFKFCRMSLYWSASETKCKIALANKAYRLEAGSDPKELRFSLPHSTDFGLMPLIAAIVFILGSIFSLPSEAAQPHLKKGVDYHLYFPAISLSKGEGERISAIEVVVHCGRFRGVSPIPNDWSTEIISPSSEETTFRASAGHGSTALWSINDWNGAITISADPSCFDISAEVTSELTDKVKKHSFDIKQLNLNP